MLVAKCPKCGQDNTINDPSIAYFICNRCGAKVLPSETQATFYPDNAQPQAQAPVAPVQPQAQFDPMQVQAPYPGQPAMPQAQQPNSNAKWIALGIVAAVVAAVVITLVIVLGGGDSDDGDAKEYSKHQKSAASSVATHNQAISDVVGEIEANM